MKFRFLALAALFACLGLLVSHSAQAQVTTGSNVVSSAIGQIQTAVQTQPSQTWQPQVQPNPHWQQSQPHPQPTWPPQTHPQPTWPPQTHPQPYPQPHPQPHPTWPPKINPHPLPYPVWPPKTNPYPPIQITPVYPPSCTYPAPRPWPQPRPHNTTSHPNSR